MGKREFWMTRTGPPLYVEDEIQIWHPSPEPPGLDEDGEWVQAMDASPIVEIEEFSFRWITGVTVPKDKPTRMRLHVEVSWPPNDLLWRLKSYGTALTSEAAGVIGDMVSKMALMEEMIEEREDDEE